MAVVGDLGGIKGSFRQAGKGAGVVGIGNRGPVPGGGDDLVQRPTKSAAVTAPAGFGVGHAGTGDLPEVIGIAALVINRPFVVLRVKKAAQKFGVRLGPVFDDGTVGGHRKQFVSLAQQIEHEPFAVVILGQRGRGIGGRIRDGNAIPRVALNGADLQLPTHAAPAVFFRRRIPQSQIRFRIISRGRARDGNRIAETAGEQIHLLLPPLAQQVGGLNLLVRGGIRAAAGARISYLSRATLQGRPQNHERH